MKSLLKRVACSSGVLLLLWCSVLWLSACTTPPSADYDGDGIVSEQEHEVWVKKAGNDAADVATTATDYLPSGPWSLLYPLIPVAAAWATREVFVHKKAKKVRKAIAEGDSQGNNDGVTRALEVAGLGSEVDKIEKLR